ncbi:glycosyltransferase [Psychroserpens luteus]|uniref:Glycosyltransferase n=1 Tax=Psychroserpens luteus TaxID=1434066 RepID=A0ABW5ZTD6_9FLAO|nr:glycosyltransferase [Psychroserpens luteus]
MTIGIVMSKPPSYSETFFNNKIIGLKKSGFDVILFVQQKEDLFKLCEVRIAPKVYRNNVLLQSFEYVKVVIKLSFIPMRLHRFISLERKVNRSWNQILKNVYNNCHILTSDVDWLHFGFATMAIQSEHVARVINAKMAISCRGYDMDVYPLKHNNVYQLLWRNVNKVHLISEYMLKRSYDNGMPKHSIYKIIFPAIDILNFERPNTTVTNSKLKFTTIARLHWIKGLSATLEALSIIKQKGILFEYTIIGEGSELEPLKFAVDQLNLTHEVTFSGRVKHKHIINMLAETDVYIQYSHSEGFCNAVLEAQAMGLLCIVSDGGGLSENVIHEQTGWVVEKRNAEALANKILEVVNLSAHEKELIVQSAIKRVKEDFNLKKQQDAFLKFYE